jgi:hypothetical protein
MKGRNKRFLACLAMACAKISAGTVSDQGTLANSTDTFITTVTLAGSQTVTLQTWGFGGGINGNGATIPAGGFDPLVAVFQGTGPGAAFIQGTSDILTNYSSFMGCPPAGTLTIGNIAGNCGDVLMALQLTAGAYTILLSDAAYIPNAVFSGTGALGDGFTDLTGGVFQTCADPANCINPTANWALDITLSDAAQAPEPGSVGTVCIGLLGLAAVLRLRSGNDNKRMQESAKGAARTAEWI